MSMTAVSQRGIYIHRLNFLSMRREVSDCVVRIYDCVAFRFPLVCELCNLKWRKISRTRCFEMKKERRATS